MKKKLKLAIVISNTDKSILFEKIAIALKNLYHISFILLNPVETQLEIFLKSNGFEVVLINYRTKKNLFSAFFKILYWMLKNRPEIVHANFLEAQITALPAAWLLRIKKRIYTRHHSNYHQIYFPKFVWIDKLSNFFSTKIISLSQSTDWTLLNLENVNIKKVVKIYHPVDYKIFSKIGKDRITELHRKWQIPSKHIKIGVISRFEVLKGYQYILPAFNRFQKLYPDSTLVIANAKGPDESKIRKMIKSMNLENIITIPFEEDIPALYCVFDIFVHVPISLLSESFGLVYVESLLAKVPSIFTLSGIASEFIVNNENAIVANFQNEDDIFNGLVRLVENPILAGKLKKNGFEKAKYLFSIDNYVNNISKIYN